MHQINYNRMSLDVLRKAGWDAALTQWYDHERNISHDLFGCADILAYVPGAEWPGGLLVQVCAAASRADRVRKVLNNKHAFNWVVGHHRLFWVMDWRKKEDNQLPRYSARVQSLLEKDFITFKETGEIPPVCRSSCSDHAESEDAISAPVKAATVIDIGERRRNKDLETTRQKLSEKSGPARVMVFTTRPHGRKPDSPT
jgi:hypothetical protein